MSGAESHHRLHVEAELGALRLDARLEFAAPWTVIFGPSGSGKSSLLRAMCGLLQASQLEFAGCASDAGGSGQWTDIDESGQHTPPYLRGLAYAPQGAILFPHMTVRENIAFSLNSRRPEAVAQPTRHAIRLDSIDEAIELFGLTALAARRPRDLSGGERQRVNLARAFAVPHPQLMLLDEPFTGIDRATRDALLSTLRHRLAQRAIPVISVTHDVEEALLLDAEVVRLDAGRVLAQGPARQVLAAERARLLDTLR